MGVVDSRDVRELAAGERSEAPRGGLYVKGRFDIDKPFARQVYELVRDGRVNEWSFSYDTIKERKASDGANELIELDLIEVGPTLKGANSETVTLSTKSANDLRRSHGLAPLRDRRRIRCLGCRKQVTVELRPPVPGGVIPWAVCSCGKVYGWSKLPTDLHVAEMGKVRRHLDKARSH